LAPSPEVSCPVCGDTLGKTVATSCQICETWYHRDCWTYNQGCGIYGCPAAPPAREDEPLVKPEAPATE
jgi:hypothetical protein